MYDTEKDIRIKRLKYRANHRGIKEMDIILGGFANARIETLSDAELDAFETLMGEQDRDLVVWFTGEVVFPHEHLKPIFEMIRQFLLSVNNDA